MKSKKFEDLRGTNTAVSCPTQADWDKVSEICEYKWTGGKWEQGAEDCAIGLNVRGFANVDYYKEKGFAIIPAADFIAANSEKAPDLSGTRPAIEWLQLLPEPYRGKALEAVKVAPNEPNRLCSYQNCINYAIDWANTNEDSDFWIAINAHIQDPSNPLPPLPSEGVEAEKGEAETDIQKLTKATMIKFAEQEKRLELMTDLCYKLQGKVNIIESKLSAKHDTTHPAISPTPAEPEVKLPVTIEDTDAFLKTLENGKTQFDHFHIGGCFLHKKTVKKVQAFVILQAISEAQNEIVPRGEWVYYAEYDISNNEIDMIKRLVTTAAHGYGLIAFHSEQGLKDCIEANKDLWMDLLKGE
jgi:hypothetical protein